MVTVAVGTVMMAARMTVVPVDTRSDSLDRSYSLFPCADTFLDTAPSFRRLFQFGTNSSQSRIQNYTLPISLHLYTRCTLRTDTIPYLLNPDFRNFSFSRTLPGRNTNSTEVSRPLACQNIALRTSGSPLERSKRLPRSAPDLPSSAAFVLRTTSTTTNNRLQRQKKKTHLKVVT